MLISYVSWSLGYAQTAACFSVKLSLNVKSRWDFLSWVKVKKVDSSGEFPIDTCEM